MKICFRLDANNDFILDPQYKKKRDAKKQPKEFLPQDVGN
jgi:hypothetical protein